MGTTQSRGYACGHRYGTAHDANAKALRQGFGVMSTAFGATSDEVSVCHGIPLAPSVLSRWLRRGIESRQLRLEG